MDTPLLQELTESLISLTHDETKRCGNVFLFLILIVTFYLTNLLNRQKGISETNPFLKISL